MDPQAARIIWVAACTTIIVLVPILFEVQREGQCLSFERLVILLPTLLSKQDHVVVIEVGSA
jgi:hypothetical protein